MDLKKIKKEQITIKNVSAVADANVKKGQEKLGILQKHIIEQTKYRILVANPNCIVNNECVVCKCETPDLFRTSVKHCERKNLDGTPNPCYGDFLDKSEWENFKSKNNIVIPNGTINEVFNKVKKDYNKQGIVSKDVTRLVKTTSPNSSYKQIKLQSDPTSTVHNDVINGQVLIGHFFIKNMEDEDIVITNIKGSCGCTAIENMNGTILKPNESLPVIYKFNSYKRIGVNTKQITTTCYFKDVKSNLGYNPNGTKSVIKFSAEVLPNTRMDEITQHLGDIHHITMNFQVCSDKEDVINLITDMEEIEIGSVKIAEGKTDLFLDSLDILKRIENYDAALVKESADKYREYLNQFAQVIKERPEVESEITKGIIKGIGKPKSKIKDIKKFLEEVKNVHLLNLK